MENKGQIILYQTVDGESKIEVTLANDTVWLTIDQMAELFQRNKSTISRHIKNVFDEGELNREVVVAKFAMTTQHGAIEGKLQKHLVDFYNLDMIISIGYPLGALLATGGILLAGLLGPGLGILLFFQLFRYILGSRIII